MDDSNENISSISDPSAPGVESETHSRKQWAFRPVKVSWYAVLAAIFFGICSAAMHRKYAGGADDPQFVLADLSSLAMFIALVSGIIGLVRGIRCGNSKIVLCAIFPLLFIGGFIFLMVCLAIKNG
jgi:hypothetical protein